MLALPHVSSSPVAFEQSPQARLARLTLEQKVRLLTGADFWSLHAEPAVGLRPVVVSDGPVGVRGVTWDEHDPSATIPSPTSLAATWDLSRIDRLARLLASECGRKNVDVLLAPTVNLQRSPYAGRHFEMLSEDPFLTAQVGAAYVAGLQSQGVGATVKHFVANDSETDRYSANMILDERTLRELYLAPFEEIVTVAGAWAVMAAYNRTNGTTMTESPMLREVLHEEWGFDGVTLTDWFAGRSTEAAGNSGLDLIMPGPNGPWGDALTAAVRDGSVSQEAIDDKVLRVLRLAGRVGALQEIDGEKIDGEAAAAPTPAPWSDAEIAAEIRAAAAAGSVLVRNAAPAGPGAGDQPPVLPIDAATVRTVAVLGPNAAKGRALGGGAALVLAPYCISPLEGLTAALGPGAEVTHTPGVRAHTRLSLAEVDQLSLIDGDRSGVEVEFLASDGTLLGAQLRSTSSFTWQGDVGGFTAGEVAAFRVRTRFTAKETGTHVIGASGIGRFALDLDGVPQFGVVLGLDEGADPAEGMMRPPQHGCDVPLSSGQTADVTLTFEPVSEASSFDAAMVSFQLNIEPPHLEDSAEIERAVALAAAADVAIVVVGTNEEVESEGFDRASLRLPGAQDELIAQVAEANPRTVVVVNSGAPVLMPWRTDVAAVLVVWFPGQEFGNALADVLLGLVEPGGRLPTTWPAVEDSSLPATRPVDGDVVYSEGLHIGHRRFLREQAEPAYWFGHGLGYTSWTYGDLSVRGDGDGGATVTLVVTNTGDRPGREVVQIYAARPDSGIDRPARWLAGFSTVDALPGEATVVETRIRRRAFEHWDTGTQRWTLEPGAFELHGARSAAAIEASVAFDPGASG